jgi:hypothetical protein
MEEAEPSQEDDSRLTVEAETRARLLEHAGEFYADVIAEQHIGIGGLNVLVSCSAERYPWTPEGHRVTLLRPEVLGLRVVAKGERPDDIVDAIRDGQLVVEGVIGGPLNRMFPDGEPDER